MTTPIRNLQDLQKAAGKVAPVFEALAVTAAAAFTEIAKHVIDTADEMGKFAQKAGVTTEAFSSLAYGAELSGVNAEGLSKAFKELSKNLSEAQVYGSPAANMFVQLGIATRGANGEMMSADQVLLKLADAFADHADGVNKTTTAVKLFGRAGQDMIPFLNQGANGIREMQEEAGLFGKTISTQTGKDAEAFNDNLKKMKAIVEGVANVFISEMLPTLKTLSEELIGAAKGGQELGAVFSVIRVLADAAAYWLVVFANGIKASFDNLQAMTELLFRFGTAAKDAFVLAWHGAKNFGDILIELAKGPFGNAQQALTAATKQMRMDLGTLEGDAIKTLSSVANVVSVFGSGVDKTLGAALGRPSSTSPQTPSESKGAKSPMPNPDAGAGKGFQDLPSGWSMESYQLDQQMQIATQKAMLETFGVKTTVSERLRALNALQTQEEELSFNNRIKQITDLQMFESSKYPLYEAAYAEHAARMKKINADMAKSTLDSHLQMFQGVSSILGSFASVAQAFGKKSFVAYQAFAIGQAIVSTALGVTRALGAADPPINFIEAAAVAAAGAAQIATIVMQKPPQAHAGATFIPEDATYFLKGGERVLAPEQNRDLTQFLSGSGTMNVQVNLDGREILRYIGQASRAGVLEINARAVV